MHYEYDRYGNMLRQSVTNLDNQTEARSFDFSTYAAGIAEQNRLPGEKGFQYDEAGNLIEIYDAVAEDQQIFSFDIMNRLMGYTRSWIGADGKPMYLMASYEYNDSMERIRSWYSTSKMCDYVPCNGEYRLIENRNVRYFNAPSGELLTEEILEERIEMPPPEEGKQFPAPLETTEESVKYQFTDHLGTARFVAGLSWMLANIDGVWSYQVSEMETPEHVTPYGSLLFPSGSGINPEFLVRADPFLFTGKSRDRESGLDYFGERYFSNTWCRWISADQPFADNYIEKPTSWNLYLYVRNNPINSADPNGSETLEGIAEGGLDFIKTVGAGVFETHKMMALGAPYAAYTSYETIKSTGNAWLSQEGRDRMSNTWEHLSHTRKVAVLTNLALQLVTAALTTAWAFNAPARAPMTSKVHTSGVSNTVRQGPGAMKTLPAAPSRTPAARVATTRKLQSHRKPR